MTLHSDTPRRRHVFGPVPSRRLGKSLGVDLVPYKTCTLDCVYCQLKRTTDLRLERASFFDWRDAVDEVRAVLASGREVDVVTLSGSGEPTLNADLGRILEALEQAAPGIPKAVITNGTLLWRQDVRDELAQAQLVMPSLDAARVASFQAVNRPAPGLDLARWSEGLRRFVQDFSGRVWLEILLVKGLNDQPADLEALCAVLEGLPVERVQLNTVVRTPTEPRVARAVDSQTLQRFREALAAVIPGRVEILQDFQKDARRTRPVDADELLSLLLRRPCTLEELPRATGGDPAQIRSLVEALRLQGKLREDAHGYLFLP